MSAAGVTGTIEPIFLNRLMSAESEADFSSETKQLAFTYYQALIEAIKIEQDMAAEAITEDTAETLRLSYGLARREVIKQQYAGVGEAVSPQLAMES